MNLAKRILQGEQLTKETVLKIYEDTNIDTLDLLNEAYILRKHYFGKKVKLNMILNAKSGNVLRIVGTVDNHEILNKNSDML